MSQQAVEWVATQLSIPSSFVIELCEEGIVIIEDPDVPEYVVEQVRVCWTLREELGVNLAGVEVILHLLGVIERDRRILAGKD